MSYPRWKHEDCFPDIFDTIRNLCERKKEEWILHDEIVTALLDNLTIVKLASAVQALIGQDLRAIIANMVAWFSQKITQYENGNLEPESYSEFDLIEEAYKTFDRKKIEERYAYKLRSTLKPRPEVAEKILKRMEAREEEAKKREAYRGYVEVVKKLKEEEKLSAEEYRELIMLSPEKGKELLRKRGLIP